MKRHIDLTLPFVGIRGDLSGEWFEPTMGEHLCKSLEEDMLDVDISTGGWYGADELGVVESIAKKDRPTYLVPAGEYVSFTLSTEEEYYEMVVHWTLRYRTATSGVQEASFDFKRLADTLSLDDVPILGGPGPVVPRSVT